MKSITWETLNATAEGDKNYLCSVCGSDGGLRFTGSHYARLETEEGMQACHLVMSMLFTSIKMWVFFLLF